MEVNKYRLMLNIMEFIDDKLDSDIEEESIKILLELKKIVLNELKSKE